LADSSTDFLTFLSGRGLGLGLKITIKSVEPIDGSVLVSYANKRREMLSHTICDRLLVEKI
jgi:DtxR family Mn-dependent transcriptional regulator